MSVLNPFTLGISLLNCLQLILMRSLRIFSFMQCILRFMDLDAPADVDVPAKYVSLREFSSSLMASSMDEADEELGETDEDGVSMLVAA